MPVEKISDAPANIQELDDVKLTLAQVNWILNVYDGLEGDPDIENPMAVAISQFRKSWRVEDGAWVKRETKGEATLAEASRDEELRRIRDSFWEKFNPPHQVMESPANLWVLDIFDEYLIAESTDKLYRVGFSEESGGKVTFQPFDQWTEVERSFSPLAAFVGGLRSLWGQAQQLFAPTSAQQVILSSPSPTGQIYALTGGSERELLVDDDGLVWKDLLVDGKWYTLDGEEVVVTPEAIDMVFDSFTNGNLYPIPVPFGHVEHLGGDDPANNNGFVQTMKIGGLDHPDSEPNGEQVLWVGMNITEPETLEKLQRGSIQNVSAWLEPEVHDNKDEGKVWPLVLWHVALTDKPQLDLKPFVAFSATRERRQVMSTPKKNAQPTEVPPEEEPQDELEKLRAELQAARDADAKNAAEIAALQGQVDGLTSQLADSEKAVHAREVEATLAALQGVGRHERVNLGGGMVPPAVLSVIRPVLLADEPKQGKRLILSVTRKNGDGEETVELSPTQIVLDVVNAFAAAGLLLDSASRGQTDHSDPSATTDEQRKAASRKRVKEWKEAHPEAEQQ